MASRTPSGPKFEASRHLNDLKIMHRDIFQGRDRKNGVCEQPGPHQESSDEADGPAFYSPELSETNEPVCLAGFQLQQHGSQAWYSRPPKPEAKKMAEAVRPMKVLAWSQHTSTV